MQTIVGLYDNRKDAQEAYDDLLRQGFSVQDVSVITNQAKDAGMLNDLPSHVPEPDVRFYMKGAQAGGTLIVVDAENAQLAQQAGGILVGHHMVDVDARVAEWSKTQVRAQEQVQLRDFDDNDMVLQEVEEQLQVGKIAVERGKMRIYSRVTERPVQAQVNLRDETLRVQRRAVDRPIAAGEEPFKERSYQLTETDEEAVVSKTARVTGEVALTKEASEQAQIIQETVRRTEVEVEEVRPTTAPAPTQPTTTTTRPAQPQR